MVSVGAILKTARERKGISLNDVEKAIKVRQKFIDALEHDSWDLFTSKIYIIGILKNYARFLSLDEKKILAFFRREYEKKEDVRFKERVSKRYFSSDSRKAIWIGFGLICLLLTGYFVYQLFQYVRPPQVVILQPIQNSFRHESAVRVVGKTEKEASITIFGEKIFQNNEGVFEYTLPLKQKKTELIIEVIGANGKKTVLKKTFELLN